MERGEREIGTENFLGGVGGCMNRKRGGGTRELGSGKGSWKFLGLLKWEDSEWGNHECADWEYGDWEYGDWE